MGSSQIRNMMPTRNPAKLSIDLLPETDILPEVRSDPPNFSQGDLSQEQHRVCGAMAQQSGDSSWGNQSAPQKLLHLVGCRERKAPTKRPSPKR